MLFETSYDGLLLIHKTEGYILNSNASAQKLLGYPPEEFSEKKLWKIGLTRDNMEFQEIVPKLEKDGVIHYEDKPIKTKQDV